jgi:hypothetical protein
VAALAGSGELLVSSTVNDLVAGSGLRFEEPGAHCLKDVPEEWRLFAAEATVPAPEERPGRRRRPRGPTVVFPPLTIPHRLL